VDIPSALPCVGCGFCCLKARCALSIGYELHEEDRDLKREGPICPYLYLEHGRFRCELAQRYPVELNIGAGCCSSLNSYRDTFRQFLREK
jgi:hypothetical protein